VNPGREVLTQLYVERGLSLAEVGRIIGVTNQSVMRYLRCEGVAMRSKSEARVIAAKKYPNGEKQREAARKNAKKARAAVTAESYEKMVATRKVNGVNHPIGPDNHMWRGGITPLYARKSWAIRARECWDRDGWICQECGCECYGRRLAQRVDPRRCVQAHHIVPRRNGGSNELENLVTLCRTCHRGREAAGINALFA
jgi:uncharacterized protein YjhX (UPF0386 family)